MPKHDMSNYFASEMERIFNSDEHKQIFGTAKELEKVAFSRVADEDKLTSEVEIDLLATAEKEKCCECASKEGKGKDCKCDCHPKESKEDNKEDKKPWEKKDASTVEKLLAVSEELDAVGLTRLAGMALKFAGLVIQAKAKKSDKRSDKEKAKAKADKEKAKAKKEKAEKAKEDKEKAKAKADKEKAKASKEKAKAKSSKKSAGYLSRMKLGQQVAPPGTPIVDYSGGKDPSHPAPPAPGHAKPAAPHGKDVDLIKAALSPQVLAGIVSLEAGPLPSGGGQVTVKLKGGPGDDAAFKAVQSVVQQLQNANKLSAVPYKVVGH